MTDLHGHEPTRFFWEAGSDDCPHGPQPDYRTDGEAWDIWAERHPASPQDVRICLDAPASICCPACTAEDGDSVPWTHCRDRAHARPRPQPEQPQHRPVTAEVGSMECLERECDEYFTDDGGEIPGKTSCSHIHDMEVCEACSDLPSEADFPAVVAWADCPHKPAAAATPAVPRP